jgi:recombinational DNA repair ATPase RecF
LQARVSEIIIHYPIQEFPICAISIFTSPELLTGENGAGKTNTLDAIHYLCLGKSYFHPGDQQSVKHDGSFSGWKVFFKNTEEQHALTCVFAMGGKKELSRNIYYL